MTFDELKRFSPLYKNSVHAGAAAILNASFGFNDDQVVPLSISHGVDFDMCRMAMDVHAVEPVHWAYNESIFERAIVIKPSVRLPHPWWFVVKDQEVPEGEKTLVIGPPPGRTNDERLLAILQNKYDLHEVDILIKQRGTADGSAEFWRKNGLGVVTAGLQDNAFYHRLFGILKNYSLVVCCTFSSAAIFAASIGKLVNFLKDYQYKAYDVANCLNVMDFDSKRAKHIVSCFLEAENEMVANLASNLLGFSDEPVADLKARYIKAVSSIRSPTANKSRISKFARELALVTGKPGLASLQLGRGFEKFVHRKKIAELEVNEVSVWTNGLNSENFKMRLVSYVKGKTEPGTAVDVYD